MSNHGTGDDRTRSAEPTRGGAGVAELFALAKNDVAAIVLISLMMLSIKEFKLLPNLPFAPGQKLALLTPLYLIATLKTKTRVGASLTGLVMGSVALLLGDGRYGILEIVKHVTPGILCDLLVPFVLAGGRRPGAIAWSLVGGAMGLGRFATIAAVTLTTHGPAVAWASLVPGLVIHTTFGVLAGLASFPLIRAMMRRGSPPLPIAQDPVSKANIARAPEAAKAASDLETKST